MRALGIDPGFGRCGIGVVDKNDNEYVHIMHTCLETTGELQERIYSIGESIKAVINTYSPDIIGLEALFSKSNVTTVMGVSHIQGLVYYFAQNYSKKVYLYEPTTIKLAVTGYGRADKHQVQHMVATLLALPSIPQPDDAADALACAYTALIHRRIDRSIIDPS